MLRAIVPLIWPCKKLVSTLGPIVARIQEAIVVLTHNLPDKLPLAAPQNTSLSEVYWQDTQLNGQ